MSKPAESERHLCVRVPGSVFSQFERAVLLQGARRGRRQSTQETVLALVSSFIETQAKTERARV